MIRLVRMNCVSQSYIVILFILCVLPFDVFLIRIYLSVMKFKTRVNSPLLYKNAVIVERFMLAMGVGVQEILFFSKRRGGGFRGLFSVIFLCEFNKPAFSRGRERPAHYGYFLI